MTTEPSRQLMHLTMCVEDETLYNEYKSIVSKHNLRLLGNFDEMDAGFDLITPQAETCMAKHVNKINFGVKCAASMGTCRVENGDVVWSALDTCVASAFYMHPRSSLSKKPLRLANSTGIIDAGYRGPLIGMFDCIYGEQYRVERGDRLLQICSPTLCPIFVQLVKDQSCLGSQTMRGEGGFGSTGA